VASALARLSQRELFAREDDLVFAGETGSFLDGSALRRHKDALARADLRPLRFHDLRHTFGTRMIAKADIRRVQEWMGHADIQTTMRYLHYAPRAEDARLVAEAFRVDEPGMGLDPATAPEDEPRDSPRCGRGSAREDR
jgi:integrase